VKLSQELSLVKGEKKKRTKQKEKFKTDDFSSRLVD
jgi:hypothetical protein